MCLIVWKEGKEAFFTNRQFKNMISRNADGLGIMWRENDRVMVDKVLGSPKDKFKVFQKHRNKPYFAMHARLKTHGLIDLNNCHPYELMNKDKGDPIDLYMMHNGVLSDMPDVDNKMSDTWHFVEYVLKPIAKSNLSLIWDSQEFQTWLSKKLNSSKLLFMRSDTVEGQSPVLIFNKSLGKDENGCWLSNTYSTSTYYSGGNASTNQNFRQELGKPAQLPVVTQVLSKDNMQDTDTTTTEIGTNVIELSQFRDTSYSIIPDESLYRTVCSLRGLQWYQLRLFVIDDPDLTADIIMAFYEKNTMKYENIIEQINNKDTLNGIVNIIQHVAHTIESIVKTRNL